jgi:hypothetical protein
MNPTEHARLSVKAHGGHIDDYLHIHEWFDSSKAHVPDMRHRAMFHHSWGIYQAQEKFGIYLTVESTGDIVAVRDIGEEHVLQDMGRIPTLQDYLQTMPMLDWLGGRVKSRRIIDLAD